MADIKTNPRYIKLMPLGDSMTDGFTSVGAYRVALCNRLEKNDYSQYVDFVGSNVGGDCYDNSHAGFTGIAIDPIAESISGGRSGISELVPSLMADNSPDVVLMQIGTNDILSIYDLDNADKRLKNLCNMILDALPTDGMLFVATIPVMDATVETYISPEFFTVGSMDKYVEDYNEKVRAVVAELSAHGKNITLIENNKLLTKSDLCDGVHPTEEGYAKIGENWYDIVVDYIGLRSFEQTN